MQQMLNNIGRVYPVIAQLNPDGIFGPLTEASVRAFQTFFGLNPDGVIGPLTWARIVDVNANLPNVTAPSFPGNLQVGSSGNNVRVLQQHLNDLVPFYPTITRLNVDGSFGPVTQSSVTAFQRVFGMTQSGIANQTTWNLIVSMRNLLTQGQAAQVFEDFHKPVIFGEEEVIPTFVQVSDPQPRSDIYDMFVCMVAFQLLRNRYR